MTVQRLTHVGICVADLERALRFYRDGLGFAEVGRLEAGGPTAETLLRLPGAHLHAVYLERDGVRVELLAYARPGHTGPAEPRPMNQLGLTHLSVRIGDLDKALDALRAHGGRVLDETRIDVPQARTRAVFVTDPDGTRIELVQAPGDPAALPRAG